MVAIISSRSRTGTLLRACLNFIGDVFFFALMFLAVLLMAINLKETFDSLAPSLGLAKGTSTLKNVAQSTNAGIPAGPVAIESCTAGQLATIQLQLPSGECLQYANSPFMHGGLCSFSYATRCPQSRWLHDYYKKLKPSGEKRLAIYVGSSKAVDAVNTMRMLSFNASYDKYLWRKTYSENRAIDYESCQSRTDPSFSIPSEIPVSQVDVHVLEASPEITKELVRTQQTLNYGSNLRIINAAVADTDGTIKAADGSDVKQYRLDTYVEEHVDISQPIDYLGFQLGAEDAPALAGAWETLANVNYMEFEYNWKGSWSQYTLSAMINRLKEKGLVCYWAGTAGNLWRITDCWKDYYDIKMWSRIACVKKTHHGLLGQMEDYFNKTLEAGARIQYRDRSSAETNGRG
jgi:hypothetical protein